MSSTTRREEVFRSRLLKPEIEPGTTYARAREAWFARWSSTLDLLGAVAGEVLILCDAGNVPAARAKWAASVTQYTIDFIHTVGLLNEWYMLSISYNDDEFRSAMTSFAELEQ